jgi:hypothetical protein
MGETSNTSKMAEFVSSDIFKYLGWERVGSSNINWECVTASHGRNTHPADAVYQYLEPYQNKMTYVLCDFKSYARDSINKRSIESALINLNDSVTCAKISPDWKEKFRNTEKHSDVIGVLFIYNHDGDFQDDFNELLASSVKKLSIDKNNIIYIMDPKQIKYYLNVAMNMKTLRGDNKLPNISACGYFYPELPNMKLFHDTSQLPLTIEYMCGSTHILRYGDQTGKGIAGLDIYTPNTGDDTGYFLYLIDYIRKCNFLQENKTIRVFMPLAKENASTNLEKAKNIYTENVDESLKEKFKKNIKYVHMPTIVTHQLFSNEIGMRD